MGPSEDLIQRLRNGGDRPASRQGPAPRSLIEPRFDPSRFSSPLLGNSALATPLRPRIIDDISRPIPQGRGLDELFPHTSHPTPPLSSSPPSRRQINFYDHDSDRNPPAPISFTNFAPKPAQAPATPVHQLSSSIGRYELQPHKSSSIHEGYEKGQRLLIDQDPASQSQMPSPPIEELTAADDTFFEPAQHPPATQGAQAQFQQMAESEDEYAVDDQWFESAMAEVDLDRIQSKSSSGQHSRSAPLPVARPGPERNITRSPYFPLSSQAPQTQQLGQLRSSSRLNNTSSSVTFPKRPGSGLQMRPNAATPPLLTPTPRKAFTTRQHNRSHEPSEPADTSGLVPVSDLGTSVIMLLTLIADTHEETRLFFFQHFNKMQSAVFEAAYRSDENLVVSGACLLTFWCLTNSADWVR